MSIYKELSYDQDIDVVRGIQFSVLGPQEIIKRSVVEVNKSETYVGNEPIVGGLFDQRMGILEQNKICTTCQQKNVFCPGHFGHIKLARPVFHPLFFDEVYKLLRCVCHRCSRLLVSSDVHTDLPDNATDMQKKKRNDMKKAIAIKNNRKRWEMVQDICSTIKVCGEDGTPGCRAQHPSKISKTNEFRILVQVARNMEPRIYSAEDVLRIFERITERDMEALGFNPQWNRPEFMVMTVLAVPPPAVRPSIIEESGARREDDLTHKLADILKINNQLHDRLEKKNMTEEQAKIMTLALQYNVATFMDNQISGLHPAQQRNGRKLKSIADRLRKKEGRIRGNLNGKRVDQSARSVITPDPYICLDEVGVPVKVAMSITFPEFVNEYNMEEMQMLVRNGPDTWPGAKYVRIAETGVTKTLKFCDVEKVANELRVGDIVDRHLRDGDYVLFNRQPSLHRMSMMGHRVKIMSGQTFRISPSVCSAFNADFDGDKFILSPTGSCW